MKAPSFAPMPPKYSRLLAVVEASLKIFNDSGDVARSLLDNETQAEFDATLKQNLKSLKTAGTGVMAAQRTIVYARLLQDALRDWREHGSEHPQEAP